jgi:hypothetical protein
VPDALPERPERQPQDARLRVERERRVAEQARQAVRVLRDAGVLQYESAGRTTERWDESVEPVRVLWDVQPTVALELRALVQLQASTPRPELLAQRSELELPVLLARQPSAVRAALAEPQRVPGQQVSAQELALEP